MGVVTINRTFLYIGCLGEGDKELIFSVIDLHIEKSDTQGFSFTGRPGAEDKTLDFEPMKKDDKAFERGI